MRPCCRLFWDQGIMTEMNVSLPSPLQEWVEQRIKSGSYADSSDYIRDLIRRDQSYCAKREALLAHLAEGERDIASGRAVTLSSDQDIADFFANIRTRRSDEAPSD